MCYQHLQGTAFQKMQSNSSQKGRNVHGRVCRSEMTKLFEWTFAQKWSAKEEENYHSDYTVIGELTDLWGEKNRYTSEAQGFEVDGRRGEQGSHSTGITARCGPISPGVCPHLAVQHTLWCQPLPPASPQPSWWHSTTCTLGLWRCSPLGEWAAGTMTSPRERGKGRVSHTPGWGESAPLMACILHISLYWG